MIDQSSQGTVPAAPKIVVFACNWCSYTAADLAGTTRLKMPPNFTVIRVMCSGRVDPVVLLHALGRGADGVLVTGCHPGDCHYVNGNVQARKRMDFLQEILAHLGLRERVEMHYISASEGKRFQDVVTLFATRMAKLGPSPLSPSSEALPLGKRDALLYLLRRFVEDLAADIPSGAALPQELIVEGFGEPVLDPERCIGCGACVASCPSHNIRLLDQEGHRTITHFHDRCVACKTCSEVCPQEAISVRSKLELAAFVAGRAQQATRLELRTCAHCGQAIAPIRHVDAVGEKFPDGGGPSPLCERCRRHTHAVQVLSALHHTPESTGGEL